MDHVINRLYRLNFDERYKVLYKPTGRFVVGGPKGDSGLTGRRLLWILMGMGRHEVHFRGKTRQRLTVQPHTQPDMLQKHRRSRLASG